jgi:nucleotide-binding universal stress UspA family protein
MAEINFSKILVAIDGSESSLDATNYAIGMAEIYLSELMALYIVSTKMITILTCHLKSCQDQ